MFLSWQLNVSRGQSSCRDSYSPYQTCLFTGCEKKQWSCLCQALESCRSTFACEKPTCHHFKNSRPSSDSAHVHQVFPGAEAQLETWGTRCPSLSHYITVFAFSTDCTALHRQGGKHERQRKTLGGRGQRLAVENKTWWCVYCCHLRWVHDLTAEMFTHRWAAKVSNKVFVHVCLLAKYSMNHWRDCDTILDSCHNRVNIKYQKMSKTLSVLQRWS